MLFSIITINYNNAEGLEGTIQSVVSQQFIDYEYIVVDGNSTDDSLDLLKKYSSYITFYISEPDKGVYDALNKGVQVAKGDYIIFMNSGDRFYSENVLNVFSKVINNQSVDVYYGDSLGIFIDDREDYLIQQPECLDLNFWLFNSLNHQSTAIKRSLFMEYGMYDDNLKIVSDWKWFFNIYINHRKKFLKIPSILSYYDMHGVSTNGNFKKVHMQEREDTIKSSFAEYWESYLSIQKYNELKNEYAGKRFEDFLLIQKYPILYRFLKSFMDILLIFTSRK
jgi:glycosyltransferase involved in cell wall biosynthesis